MIQNLVTGLIIKIIIGINMDSQSLTSLIHQQYLTILNKITGGKIFGKNINTQSDVETLVVAAFYAGKLEEQNTPENQW
jgi:hypothetical protein